MSLADFSAHATAVFEARSLEQKRDRCEDMITVMRSPAHKKAYFREQIKTMTARQLDKFAADCFLVDTDKVIR